MVELWVVCDSLFFCVSHIFFNTHVSLLFDKKLKDKGEIQAVPCVAQNS